MIIENNNIVEINAYMLHLSVYKYVYQKYICLHDKSIFCNQTILENIR